MKKCFLLCVALVLLLAGCLERQDQRRSLKGLGDYVITLEISQTHFTTDIHEHIADAMDELVMDIPVSKEFYNSVEVGDVISNEFKVGELMKNGSYSSWTVKVTKKTYKGGDP